MRPEPRAQLAVLLASTGLTQEEAAQMVGVAGRTLRRWMEGVRLAPVSSLDRLSAFARSLDQVADLTIRTMDEDNAAAAPLLVYSRDEDLPPWSGYRTAHTHLALVRRVFERRPDVKLLTFDRWAYRRWLGARLDSREMRAAWAASRLRPLSRSPAQPAANPLGPQEGPQ